MRCMHEAQLHENNCFITLTYSDEHLPNDRSVNVVDFQLFMKRLRKRFGKGIRFYHCGEYGEKFRRPHYHACLFNFDFSDKELFKIDNNNKLYISKSLQKLWPFGHSLIGDVTFESAAYVARYIMKKQTGDNASKHYEHIDPETGEVFQLRPEYTTQSRKPGLAMGWYEKFKRDVYNNDFVIVRGRKMRPPKFYDRKFEIDDPDEFRKIKRARKSSAGEHAENNTPQRLKVREQVQRERLSRLPRKLEGDL